MNTLTQKAEAELEYSEHPHRRYNPLTRKWLLCSPHRAKRPWLGSEVCFVCQQAL